MDIVPTSQGFVKLTGNQIIIDAVSMLCQNVAVSGGQTEVGTLLSTILRGDVCGPMSR